MEDQQHGDARAPRILVFRGKPRREWIKLARMAQFGPEITSAENRCRALRGRQADQDEDVGRELRARRCVPRLLLAHFGARAAA